MTKVYFLCTGNSCRSQMAEGFAKKYFPNWTVESAGVENHGLNPKAVEVMQELNIDISDQYSKLIDEKYLNSSDLVVTLCGDARDKCPMTPPNVKRVHWGLIDPAQAEGTNTEVMDVFREVRDEINNRVKVMDDVFK